MPLSWPQGPKAEPAGLCNGPVLEAVAEQDEPQEYDRPREGAPLREERDPADTPPGLAAEDGGEESEPRDQRREERDPRQYLPGIHVVWPFFCGHLPRFAPSCSYANCRGLSAVTIGISVHTICRLT